MPTPEVPVLVVGAGPTGLAASLTLSRLGVEHVLADRHAGPLHNPKAVGIMQRTAELLRGWGAEDEIRARVTLTPVLPVAVTRESNQVALNI